MNFGDMPLIRVEIDNLRASVLHHLGLAGSQLGEYIDAEVKKAIEAYPWEKNVREAVHGAITNAVHGYFEHGKGYLALGKAVDDALKQLGNSK